MKQETKKSKTGLLLGLGLGLSVVVVGLSSCDRFMKNNKNNEETEAFNACISIADYRAYMKQYGPKGIHYSDAKNVVDRYVADSLEKSVAREKALRKAEAEEREDEFYMNCTTIAACDKYLKEYPRGRYVAEVEEIKADLEKQAAVKAEKEEEEAYKKCTTIEGCKNYLKAYPNGKYASVVKKKKAELEKKEADAKKKETTTKKKEVKPVTPNKTVVKPKNNNNNNNNNNSGNSTVKAKTNQQKTTPKNESKTKAVKIKK